jgi:undecaprenyl-diphosphatase
MLNGLLLFGAEALRRRAPETTEDDDARIATQVGFREAFLVGAAQALALIPGFSRSGRRWAPPASKRLHSERRGTFTQIGTLAEKLAGIQKR